jgi:SSS family solute:Na+ symporter
VHAQLGAIDIGILILYAIILIGMGIYFVKKSRTSEQFMVAGRSIPAWAAGLAVMSAYTSSISYIATPGKAYDHNWHPLIFALTILPVAWVVCKFVVPYYRETKLISVYSFLEERLGTWARFYAGISFLLYEMGRVAVILYLVGLLLSTFVPLHIAWLIVIIGLITIFYTLLGGMEAVIWTDVMQSAIMIVGILFCAVILTLDTFTGANPLIQSAFDGNKFSLGDTDLTLYKRTIWVMIIYGVAENLRNLIGDQNYVQKYVSVGSVKEATRSIWIAMLIYIPLTAVFLYIGTTLFAFYSPTGIPLPDSISKGDEIFPYFIATQVPFGLRGLIIAAIVAAAMSTVDSTLNCSATISLLDFWKRYINPAISEARSVLFLRVMTVFWGVIGIFFAILMIRAKSALDVWWEIAGIFGGGILGLFLLALFRIPLRLWQGIISIALSVVVIVWGTFMRNLSEPYRFLECRIDPILTGMLGTAAMLILALIFGWRNRKHV